MLCFTVHIHQKASKCFLCDWDSKSFSSPPTPMEVHVYDKLQLAQQEQSFEGPYRSIVGVTFPVC